MSALFAVIASFFLIFSFSSVDSSISPMIMEIAQAYKKNPEAALLFISYCTFATAFGVFFGPMVLSFFKPRYVGLVASFILALSILVFTASDNFLIGVSSRIVSGLMSGLAAALMWWLAYHGVGKNHMGAMLAVLMSARPMAVAIGVPAAGLLAYKFSWALPLNALAFMSVFFGVMLFLLFPKGDGTIPERRFLSAYVKALDVPYSLPFYLGFFLNKMCYFGFYAIAGLWFYRHYGLNLKQISLYLLYIGLAEVLMTFFSARLVKLYGFKKTFVYPVLGSLICLVFFIYGRLSIKSAIVLISLFMLADRVYTMAIIMRIPAMFKIEGDKTVFGSLNTLTAWLSMSFVSAVAAFTIKKYSMAYVETLMIVCFLIGSAFLYHCLKKTENNT